MAKTPFTDLGSENILSAHLSGIQHAVNKVEDILNLQTEAVTGHALKAVVDQSDATLHYYIYEGKVRNWLADPKPVIYRNGAVVSAGEYQVQPAYGVVVFKVQQDPAHVITANFTRVTGQSTVISNLNSALATVQGNVTALTGRVSTLESSGGGGGGAGATGGSYAYSSGGGKLDADGSLTVPSGDVWLTVGGKKVSDVTYFGTPLNVGTHNLDAFPFYLSERTTIDKMRTIVGKQNAAGTQQGVMGIYSNADGMPDKRLVYTATHSEATAGEIEAEFTSGAVTLEAGLYWIGRVSNSTMQIKAVAAASAVPLNLPADFPRNSSNPSGGICRAYRTTWSNMATLPGVWPKTATQGVSRETVGYNAPEVHVAKVYL